MKMKFYYQTDCKSDLYQVLKERVQVPEVQVQVPVLGVQVQVLHDFDALEQRLTKVWYGLEQSQR